MRELSGLVGKAESPAFSGFSVAGLCLFSKTGFDDAVLERASAHTLYLFDQNRLLTSHS